MNAGSIHFKQCHATDSCISFHCHRFMHGQSCSSNVVISDITAMLSMQTYLLSSCDSWARYLMADGYLADSGIFRDDAKQAMASTLSAEDAPSDVPERDTVYLANRPETDQ